MKRYVLKNSNGKFLRKKVSSGYKSREWVDNVWDATLFRRKGDASQAIFWRTRDTVDVVEVEVRVTIPE